MSNQAAYQSPTKSERSISPSDEPLYDYVGLEEVVTAETAPEKPKKQKRGREDQDDTVESTAGKRRSTKVERKSSGSGPLALRQLEEVEAAVDATAAAVDRHQAEEQKAQLSTVTTDVKELTARLEEKEKKWAEEKLQLTAMIKQNATNHHNMWEANKKMYGVIGKLAQSTTKLQETIQSNPLLQQGPQSVAGLLRELKLDGQKHQSTLTAVHTLAKETNGRIPDGRKTAKDADQFAKLVKQEIGTAGECGLCDRPNHQTVQCRTYKKATDRVNQAEARGICVACLGSKDSPDHFECPAAQLQCQRCSATGFKGDVANHNSIFCFLEPSIDKKRGHGGHGPLGRH